MEPITIEDLTIKDAYLEGYAIMSQNLNGEHSYIVINPEQARELFNFLKEKYKF